MHIYTKYSNIRADNAKKSFPFIISLANVNKFAENFGGFVHIY